LSRGRKFAHRRQSRYISEFGLRLQQGVRGPLAVGDVHDRADKIQIRKATNSGAANGVHVLDRTIRELQAVLVLEACAITGIHLRLVYKAGAVVRMNDVDDHRHRWDDLRCEAEDPVRLARPEQLSGRRVPTPAASLTQGLR